MARALRIDGEGDLYHRICRPLTQWNALVSHRIDLAASAITAPSPPDYECSIGSETLPRQAIRLRANPRSCDSSRLIYWKEYDECATPNRERGQAIRGALRRNSA
jgi:hypothetical protein